MVRKICLICSAPTKVKHCRVWACEACGKFFRRHLAAELDCEEEKKCLINKENRRKSCKYCRMAKCIRVGMNVDNDSNHEEDSVEEVDQTENDELRNQIKILETTTAKTIEDLNTKINVLTVENSSLKRQGLQKDALIGELRAKYSRLENKMEAFKVKVAENEALRRRQYDEMLQL